MPLPKAYQTYQRAMNAPTSRLETTDKGASDSFTESTAERSKCGLTYIQALELRHKNRDLYDEIFHDSAFD